MAHVDLCPDCARAWDEQLALSAALASMAGEAVPEMAGIEARVLAEFDGAASRRRRSRWLLAAGLAAAALVGLVWVGRRAPAARPPATVTAKAARPVLPAMVATPPRAPAGQVRRKADHRQPGEKNRPFVTIPYTVPLSPLERATVVRMQIPVAALIAAGYNVQSLDPGAAVEADVLVSQDGRARAIRLSSKGEEKP
jgi:hypothetical protein